MTRALVIGGGVAGPVAAMALQEAGIDATVHEARPAATDDVGAWLGVQANGLDALRSIDDDRALHEEALRRGVDVRYGARLVDAHDTEDG